MKKILILAVLIFTFFNKVYAQNSPIDFETAGFGSNWTWTVFENATNPPLEIILNPFQTGINVSDTVAKFTSKLAGQPWAGCESLHGTDLGSFSFDSSNCIIKIMVWKNVISDVGIKFVDSTAAAQPEIKIANTLINQWEELTFDFSSRIGIYPIVKDQIVIFPDFDLNGRNEDNIIYFDNIRFTSISPVSTQNMNTEIEMQRVFPNPSTGIFNISFKPESTNEINLRVFNQIGEVIYTQEFGYIKGNYTKEVDLSRFANGIYFLQVITDKSIFNKRLILH